MATISAIRKNSDDRAELRRAIAEAAKAREVVTAHTAAIERAEALLAEAESRFEAASAAVDAARSEHAKQVVTEIAAGSRPMPSSLLRTARAAAEDSESELHAVRAALQQLEASTADLVSTVWLAQQEVEAQIDRLVAPIARQILEEAKHLETELTQ
jgi:DNA repair exonuclease SbcCD ATPase subunit